MSRPIYHALVLNLHQPPGNLDLLLQDPLTAHEPREILFAYDRIPRAVEGFEDIARVHLSLSGTLLEALADPGFQDRFYGTVQCGDLLWRFRHPCLDLLGTGYYHPVMALIPPADRIEHVRRWLDLAGHLFAGRHQGFWPPELGFSMELIPLLVQHGYRYAIVDSEQISPITPMRWEELRYRPHLARFGGEEMVIIPRDRDLSIAQEGGMEPGWFIHEVQERTKCCPFAPLICTGTDGDNGGWFRNVEWQANFWGAFYQPFCAAARLDSGICPVFIHDYLDQHGAHGEVIVRTGSWNTGDHSGIGFLQWTGSPAQKDAWARQERISKTLHDARWAAGERGGDTGLLDEALWHLLRAQTSCHFFWGEAWVHRCHEDLDVAETCLMRATGA